MEIQEIRKVIEEKLKNYQRAKDYYTKTQNAEMIIAISTAIKSYLEENDGKG